MERGLTFDGFFVEARPRLINAIRFSVGDDDLAVEVVDEAMTRAFDRWSDVATMANPSGWVYRVASNRARNRFRRLRLERQRPQHVRLVHDDVVSDPGLARALSQLPADQRSVLVLRFYLDWSVDEVATALGLAPGTVKSRVHRGLRRLESMLEERP
jgi:RNA polymerase sigma-70 factor (ECF subfamily)